MRKIVILTLSVALLLFSCGEKHYSVSITNDSTKAVSYTYNGVSDTLAVSQTKTYEVDAYTQPPINVAEHPSGIASLVVKANGRNGDYTFSDATPLDLKVINKLPVPITIKADNYIDNGGLTELTIAADDKEETAKIYTKSPKFTSTTNYPIIVEWTVAGNEMPVIIR